MPAHEYGLASEGVAWWAAAPVIDLVESAPSWASGLSNWPRHLMWPGAPDAIGTVFGDLLLAGVCL